MLAERSAGRKGARQRGAANPCARAPFCYRPRFRRAAPVGATIILLVSLERNHPDASFAHPFPARRLQIVQHLLAVLHRVPLCGDPSFSLADRGVGKSCASDLSSGCKSGGRYRLCCDAFCVIALVCGGKNQSTQVGKGLLGALNLNLTIMRQLTLPLVPFLNHRDFGSYGFQLLRRILRPCGSDRFSIGADLGVRRRHLVGQSFYGSFAISKVTESGLSRSLAASPRYGLVGRVLIATAVQLSLEEGFRGRIALHSLPQAETFYEKNCEMTDLGLDQKKEGLRYFEMTPAQAAAFLR